MSNASRKAAQLQPPSPSAPPPPTDLASIAAMLHEAAQALLRFGKEQEAPEYDGSDSCACEREAHSSIEEGYKQGQFHEEVRCYRLPQYIVKREHELLTQHKQDDFFCLMDRVYDDLAATILLMRNLDDGTDFSGFEVHLMSELLSRPLEVLSSICSQFTDFELVQKTTIPA